MDDDATLSAIVRAAARRAVDRVNGNKSEAAGQLRHFRSRLLRLLDANAPTDDPSTTASSRIQRDSDASFPFDHDPRRAGRAAAALACGSDSTAPDTVGRPVGRPEDECARERAGTRQQHGELLGEEGRGVGRARYANSGSGGGGAEFVACASGRTRWTGVRTAPPSPSAGTSVLITATAVAGKVAVDFQPSGGLRFSGASS